MEILLTKFERQVLSDLLYDFDFSLCNGDCYCDYKKIECYDCDDNGGYKCKLRKAVQNIYDKLQL